jgi:hypothetical protein
MDAFCKSHKVGDMSGDAEAEPSGSAVSDEDAGSGATQRAACDRAEYEGENALCEGK